MTGDRLFKVEGAGNDFILGLGAWSERLWHDLELVRRLCDRHRGVGADGVLAMGVDRDAARVVLHYRNADGSPAGFCANATRCAARLAVDFLGVHRELVVATGWRDIPATVDDEQVCLHLPAPAEPPRQVELTTPTGVWRGRFLELGIPHLVLEVDGLAALDLAAVAPPLRHHPAFAPAGCNVSCVERFDGGQLAIRSWERGVEAETLCCGSAVVAAALLELARTHRRSVQVIPRAGDRLTVEVVGEPPQCPSRLYGPARVVAELTPTAAWLMAAPSS